MKKIEIIKNRSSGFTLVELILYITLVSIFVTAAIMFAWNVIYGREKSFNNQIVNENLNITLKRITYEISNANDVVSIGTNSIILDNGGSSTTIMLSGGAIFINPQGSGNYNLTSNQVNVDNLTFTDRRTTNINSKAVLVSITISQSADASSGNQSAQASAQTSVELNSQFNQARSLLLDYSQANLISGNEITGITLKNSNTADNLTIDKMMLSWSGTMGGENVNEIQIDGGSIEWSGTAATGTIIDIADYTLANSTGEVNLDYINFDSAMDSAILNITYILSDGSSVVTELILSAPSPTATPAPTDTPTPTATPTTPPATSCNQLCINASYTSGSCRKNAQDCSKNNETYLPSGDQFCTGGPNSDTCCCQ